MNWYSEIYSGLQKVACDSEAFQVNSKLSFAVNVTSNDPLKKFIVRFSTCTLRNKPSRETKQHILLNTEIGGLLFILITFLGNISGIKEVKS